MEEWLVLGLAMLATGCVAGILAGLFGIGGGVVIVPVLEAVLGFLGVDPAIRMHIAVATSLATIVPTSISSARAHHRRGAVDTDMVKRWAIFVLIGSLIGVTIASQVHSRVLAIVFATLALFVAAKLVLFPDVRNLRDSVPKGPLVPSLLTMIGCASSMMGIGGGVFSVMTLTIFGVGIHRAVGTAALFGLAISLPATVGFIVAGWGDPRVPAGNLGYVSLIGFAAIAPATILTAPIGARIAHALSEKKLSVLFGLFLVMASARLFYRGFA
ncbi:MAG: sulfite exporter TauE/SafE family protein [Woeseiaceae bacterium]|nr:sulfite exporter TauE/SafE family protein [Woeseiaceae bacterium]